ncbi:hypothetical protein Tco_0005933 [Tanacetum coccineum]
MYDLLLLALESNRWSSSKAWLKLGIVTYAVNLGDISDLGARKNLGSKSRWIPGSIPTYGVGRVIHLVYIVKFGSEMGLEDMVNEVEMWVKEKEKLFSKDLKDFFSNLPQQKVTLVVVVDRNRNFQMLSIANLILKGSKGLFFSTLATADKKLYDVPAQHDEDFHNLYKNKKKNNCKKPEISEGRKVLLEREREELDPLFLIQLFPFLGGYCVPDMYYLGEVVMNWERWFVEVIVDIRNFQMLHAANHILKDLKEGEGLYSSIWE